MLYGGGGGNIIAVHRNCSRPLKNAKWGHFLWILVLIYKYPDKVLNRTEQYEENNGDDQCKFFRHICSGPAYYENVWNA